jgi:hypothetical protein
LTKMSIHFPILFSSVSLLLACANQQDNLLKHLLSYLQNKFLSSTDSSKVRSFFLCVWINISLNLDWKNSPHSIQSDFFTSRQYVRIASRREEKCHQTPWTYLPLRSTTYFVLTSWFIAFLCNQSES